MQTHRKQRTLQGPCSVSGRGYWTGKANTLTFLPAAENTGIQFVLSGQSTSAVAENGSGLSLRTRLGNSPDAFDMVEHVMAALYGLDIDNCRIECTATEMPGFDGSSRVVALALKNVGVRTQNAERATVRITKPIRVGDETNWILAEPVAHNHLEVEYQLDYGLDSPIGVSTFRSVVTPEIFIEDIAPARTFIRKADADALQANGLATHVTAKDLIVFDDFGPVDTRLRFPDECVRHKALDLIGDLALCGTDLVGRITARKSGHQLNAEMAKQIRQLALQLPQGEWQTSRQAA